MKSILFLFTTLLFFTSARAQNNPYAKVQSELFKIDEDDQKYRYVVEALAEKTGWESPEVKVLAQKIHITDSINLLKVNCIIDKYGWLSIQDVGDQCNSVIFMVIQHSDSLTRAKYLPVMRNAVKEGKASAKDMAYLEDRILALDQGKKQLYGTQFGVYRNTNTEFILPIDDVENLDKRRASVGLKPIAEYFKSFTNNEWSIEQYKKDLPLIEAELVSYKKK